MEIFSQNANHIGKSQSWGSVGKRSGRVGGRAGHVAQVSGGRIEVGRNSRNFVRSCIGKSFPKKRSCIGNKKDLV